MATVTAVRYLGCDVSQDWVDIGDGETVQRIENQRVALRRYFRSLAGPVKVALEPTHRYHLSVLESAELAGHAVYLVDAYRLSRYRDAVGVRAKTDQADALLLSRYLRAESDSLRRWQAPPKAVQRLRQLLQARARVTQSKVALDQSLRDIGSLTATRQALLRRLDAAIAVIDRQLWRCLEASDYAAAARRCRAIPGVGALNAASLVATYYRGVFRNADAFVAFMGLDVRVRDSGRYRGRRKLSKRGDPEVRRLLFNAARAAARTVRWKGYYERLRSRGLSTTAAYVALARKLARVAFALLRDGSEYRAAAPA